MAKQSYDSQKRWKQQQDLLRMHGVAPLLCTTPGRFKVQRGNYVGNGLGVHRGMPRVR